TRSYPYAVASNERTRPTVRPRGGKAPRQTRARPTRYRRRPPPSPGALKKPNGVSPTSRVDRPTVLFV
ncbi:MAG: hypothetical protein WCA77_05655, partial [Thermoplasmata archaeon]